MVCFFFFSLSAWSRSAAAFSKSWLATASSFSLLSRLDLVVDLLQVGRAGHRLAAARGRPASSITSIALSGRQRPVM